MGIPTGQNLYSQNGGIYPENVEVPFYSQTRAPTSTDILYPVGKTWIWINNSVWRLIGFTSAGGALSANWVELASSTGAVLSVTGTANEVTAATTAGAVTLSTPSTFIAPGSIASTTTLKAGTTFSSAPVNSSVATAAFVATLTAGTSVQNATAYDLICNIVIEVSAATTATITLGVGSATGPTTNTVVASFSTAVLEIIPIVAYVPSGYFLVYNTTGTITVTSVTVQSMGV